ncbi:hypothetical protein BGZ58_003429 [Dissophora ornata]|nr:hypothetical protein BGZ58_003429 [Dissophora ornata]
MFWKKDKAGEPASQLQEMQQNPTASPASPPQSQYEALQNIDSHELPDEKASGKRRQEEPPVETLRSKDFSNTSQRRFFCPESFTLSRARNVTITGKPEPDMAAQIPAMTSTFKLVAKFNNYSAGHYTVRWRVKALKDFCIPNGLHFVVNVSYKSEPDISGTLDVIMPPHRLNLLAKDRWYNLVLEEKLVIQPHNETASIEVVMSNNVNVDRDEYFGFAIEHVEIRPMNLRVENQRDITDFVVHRAAIPNFSIDFTKVRPTGQDSSYMPTDAPVTRLASSKGSRFLASLAQSQDMAYVTVWDMSILGNPSNPGRSMSKFYKSCAVVAIPHAGVGQLPIGLSISTNGDQVALFQEPKIGEWADGSKAEKAVFPFRLFNNPMVPQASVVVDVDPPLNLNEKSEAPGGTASTGTRSRGNSNTASVGSPSEVLLLQDAPMEYELLQTFIGYGEFLPESKKSDWEKNDVNSALTSNVGGAEDTEAGDDSKDSSNKNDSSEKTSMFVACNGLYLDVFRISAEKRWKRAHTITQTGLLPTLSRRISCKMMMESISSNTFMWLEDSGRSCTIWNLLTGSNITHISSIENARFKGPTFRGHSKMAISPHESIVALASVDGSLTTYFANTGMAIDDRKFPGYKIEHVGFYAQDDQLFVILRNSVTFELSARILDTLQLKSEIFPNQVPIPTIGSTLLAFFYAKGYWNRGIICETDGSKINCYIAHQPSSSKVIKNSDTVLKAEPDDITYESLIDDNIQYHLATGIHRELLPEGDGVSYWVLRVEVLEENLTLRSKKVIFSFVPEPWMRVTTSEVVHPENLQTTFFVPCGTRFAVVGMQTLQVWNLPSAENSKCSLQFIWSQPRDDGDLEPGGIAHKSGRVRDYYLDTMNTQIYIDINTGNTVAEIKMNDKSKRKIVSIPGPGTIGARYAILYCFRSVHLLAASYAFSSRESKKTTRDSPALTFTFEDHADAIVRFTREHINRMMSIGVYSPRKWGQQNNSRGPRKPPSGKESRPIEDSANTSAEHPTPLGTITPLPEAENSRSPASVPGDAVIEDNITIHGNANRHDDDEDRPHHIHKRNPVGKTGAGSVSRPDVVTILTLLLDHPYLQSTNHIFVEGLLNSSNGDWIPRDNSALNPIKRVIESRNGPLLEAFVDYCIKNAKKYHPAYLMPAVQCLNELSDRYPIVLADLFRKASYVPVHNHSYVFSHAVIANPQYGGYIKSKLKFWRWFTGQKFEKSNNINDYDKPVFSLRSQLPFRASSTLNIMSVETSVRENRGEEFPPKRDPMEKEKKKMPAYSHKIYVSPFPKLSMYGPYRPWFKDRQAAKSAFTDIAGQDFFDSPAMVATLAFKWHKFGLFYWLLRFSIVIIFFLLVLVITAQQIYSARLPENGLAPSTEDLLGRYLTDYRPVFKGAIGFGFILIGYEFMQFIDSPSKYISSPYNYMDLAAYVTPVIGCFQFLSEKPAIDERTGIDGGPGQIWVMSFAILALYMNILFELRVIKQLGIVVNIILNITRRITWFFLIFGLFLVKWLPLPSVQAGRYDPISTSFENGSTSFHLMMVIFFFFTAILLLNILIALMNDAFNESKDQGQLAWLKQWSEVIAEVEIFLMTQSARQNRNYFPDYIYYGANEQEAELYESKYYITNKSNLSIENRFLVETVTEEQNASQLTQRAILRDVQGLTKDLEKMKQTQDGFNQDMAKLAELMAAFLAQTTTVAATNPISGLESQTSPAEHDPPASGTLPKAASGLITPASPSPTPGAGGLPGSVLRSSAAAQSRSSGMKQPGGPSGMRRKVSASAAETESPTSYSPTTPTVHFNSPQGSTVTSPVSAGDVGMQISDGRTLSDPESADASSSSALPGPSTVASSVPYRAGDQLLRERTLPTKSSQSSLKRRLQQKQAAVHTMDDALKTHHTLEENNASHPMYVRPPSRLESDDPLYSTDGEEAEDIVKPMGPLHHTQRHVQQTSHQQHVQQQTRRTHSEIIVSREPHEQVPAHAYPPHSAPEQPRQQGQEGQEEQQ